LENLILGNEKVLFDLTFPKDGGSEYHEGGFSSLFLSPPHAHEGMK